MSELGDLLELLHRAPTSYGRLAAEFRSWRHEERASEAEEEAAEESDGLVVSLPAVADADEPELPEETERLIRIWIEQPDRVRVEREGGEYVVRVSVRVGRRYWSYTEWQGALVQDLDEHAYRPLAEELAAILDPAPFLGLLDFEPGGRGERAGRPVMRAVARPRAAGESHPFLGLDRLGPGADEYLIEVDAERGIILHVEARLRGLPFSTVEAVAISYDEPIAPGRFVFEPPAGEELRTVEEALPTPRFELPLHEAAREAPFQVFVPERVPSEYQLRVSYVPGRDRPPVPAAVMLWYRTDDASAALTISETTPDMPGVLDLGNGEPRLEEIEHRGVRMRVRRAAAEWPQTQVALVKGGTAISIFSADLDADSLVELASRLVPAPVTPPSI